MFFTLTSFNVLIYFNILSFIRLTICYVVQRYSIFSFLFVVFKIVFDIMSFVLHHFIKLLFPITK